MRGVRVVDMQIRTAHPEDAASVAALLARAYPSLMAQSYDADTLAGALPAMTKANPELLASGTYYVVEDAGFLIGCGGWTFEQPGSRKVQVGLAHLRHFATDPGRARQGIGRSVFERCASVAAERGARRFQSFASLNAEPFYRRMGLVPLETIEVSMGPTTTIPVVLMEGPILT